jgi:RNA polymerase sigma factor (sigma-70 family)
VPANQLTKVIQSLRRSMLLHDSAGLSDGQLLDYFINRREETAFEAIVRRHGPMVMGVCRRILRNPDDVEDAFQATFLVLVRKARSIASRGLLGNWLYGVAFNTALKAKARRARLRTRERQVSKMPDLQAKSPELCNDLQPLLDQELSRLPEKYRVPVVLCDLEGKTRKQVARALGCPEGTVAGRLARARTILAARLARHGVGISGGVLASVLAQNTASACLKSSLIISTAKAAASLVEGQGMVAGIVSANALTLVEKVMKAMLFQRLKTLFALLAVFVVLTVGTSRFSALLTANSASERLKQNVTNRIDQKPRSEGAKAREELLKKEIAALQGTWKVVLEEKNGVKETNCTTVIINANVMTIQGTQPLVYYEIGKTIRVSGGDHTWTAKFKIDPTKKPKWFDDDTGRLFVIDDGDSGSEGRAKVLLPPARWPGIYELQGDVLKICFVWSRLEHAPKGQYQSRGDSNRPSEFKTTPKSGLALLILKREKDAP